MRRYRNVTRISVLVLMVFLVYLNRYEKKAGQLGAEQEISDSIVLSAMDRVLAAENKPMLFRGDFEGGLWSLRIFALSLSDPLAFVTSTTAARTISLTLLLSVLLPTVFILIGGRFFCSWICPYSLFAEAGTGLRGILRRVGLEYFTFDLPRPTAKMFLALSVILGAILAVPVASLIYPPRLITEGVYHLVLTGTVTAGVVFLIFLWLGEVVFSPHLFCRRVCPGGALFTLMGRYRLWRVERVDSLCDSCALCNRVCPDDLDPAAGEFPGECDNCGLCMDVCDGRDQHALRYVWRWPGRRSRKEAA